MRERQRDYELMIIISPLRSGETELNDTLSRVQQTITGVGGEVVNIDHSAPWGRRKLAYPIRRYTEGEPSRRGFTEGYYTLIHLRLPTDQITEVERQIKLNDAVIRYLITLIDQRGQQAPAESSADTLEPVAEDAEGNND